MKHILLFGNYGGQNWGDEAILSGILSGISQRDTEIMVVSSDPKHTTEHHNIPAILPPPFGFRSLFQRKYWKIFSVIRKADIVLFGGGGLLQDRERKAIFLWGYYAWLCRFFGKKPIFLANSVGPLSSSPAKRIAGKTFQKSPFISVRDEASERLLQEIGIQKQKIHKSTDAVFLSRKPPRVQQREGTLLLIRGDGNISQESLEKTLPFLPKPVHTLAMDTKDKVFAKSLSLPVLVPQNLTELRRYITSAQLVLSSRLHGGILALHSETPFCVFSAAPKVRNFFTERGLEKIIFPEDFCFRKFKKTIQDILKPHSQWQKKLSTLRKQEQKSAKNIFPFFL